MENLRSPHSSHADFAAQFLEFQLAADFSDLGSGRIGAASVKSKLYERSKLIDIRRLRAFFNRCEDFRYCRMNRRFRGVFVFGSLHGY